MYQNLISRGAGSHVASFTNDSSHSWYISLWCLIVCFLDLDLLVRDEFRSAGVQNKFSFVIIHLAFFTRTLYYRCVLFPHYTLVIFRPTNFTEKNRNLHKRSDFTDPRDHGFHRDQSTDQIALELSYLVTSLLTLQWVFLDYIQCEFSLYKWV